MGANHFYFYKSQKLDFKVLKYSVVIYISLSIKGSTIEEFIHDIELSVNDNFINSTQILKQKKNLDTFAHFYDFLKKQKN